MNIQEQIDQLRASRPIDQRSDTGWDDLSSVRFQVAHTMEKLLTVYEAALTWERDENRTDETEHNLIMAVQAAVKDDGDRK